MSSFQFYLTDRYIDFFWPHQAFAVTWNAWKFCKDVSVLKLIKSWPGASGIKVTYHVKTAYSIHHWAWTWLLIWERCSADKCGIHKSFSTLKITGRGSHDWGITNLHIVYTETGHVSFRFALCLSSDLFLVGWVSTDFHPIEKTCRKIRQAAWAAPTEIFNSLGQSYTVCTHTHTQTYTQDYRTDEQSQAPVNQISRRHPLKAGRRAERMDDSNAAACHVFHTSSLLTIQTSWAPGGPKHWNLVVQLLLPTLGDWMTAIHSFTFSLLFFFKSWRHLYPTDIQSNLQLHA